MHKSLHEQRLTWLIFSTVRDMTSLNLTWFNFSFLYLTSLDVTWHGVIWLYLTWNYSVFLSLTDLTRRDVTWHDVTSGWRNFVLCLVNPINDSLSITQEDMSPFLKSPMPGTVVSVAVEVGENVCLTVTRICERFALVMSRNLLHVCDKQEICTTSYQWILLLLLFIRFTKDRS